MKNAKHVLRNLPVFAVLAFTFISCNENGKEKPEQEDKPVVLAPAQIVKIGEAKSMYDNYSNRRVPLIQRYEDSINRADRKPKQQDSKMQAQTDDSEKFDVARFVSYDYKTIKQYLDYIEQEANAAGVEISTLRFYFSNYDDEQYFPGTKGEIKHPRQNSLLLSPTIKKGKRDHLFYVDQGAEGQETVILGDDFGRPRGMGFVSDKGNRANASIAPNFFSTSTKPVYAGKSLTMNKGTGAPPPYPQN